MHGIPPLRDGRSYDPAVAELPHPVSEKWAPYRSPKTGSVVTVTWDQIHAIEHAMKVVDEVRAANGVRPLAEDFPYKSRALGRLLFDGRPLFEDVPPKLTAAADYPLWDQENSNSEVRDFLIRMRAEVERRRAEGQDVSGTEELLARDEQQYGLR